MNVNDWYIEAINDWWFAGVYVGFDYTVAVRRHILAYKYSHHTSYIDTFANAIASMVRRTRSEEEITEAVVVNIPAHPIDTCLRLGYRPAALLADRVARYLGIPHASIGRKVRRTARQATLSRTERLINLTDAFELSEHDARGLAGKTIILVDDVISTGSTVHEFASALLRQCPEIRIYGYFLARGSGYDR